MDFGTGGLKVTPAHDPNDYALGIKHNLPVIDILNDDGTLNEKAQILVGRIALPPEKPSSNCWKNRVIW